MAQDVFDVFDPFLDERFIRRAVSSPISGGSHEGRAESLQDRIGLASEPPRDGSISWPSPLDRAAYYGLAGEITDMIEPHTESDPIAILGQLLVGFGNLIGRS